MNRTPRLLRPLLLGAVVLALASTGCSWFKHKSSYTDSVQNRPLEVPPDLDLPNTSTAVQLPGATGLGGARPGAGREVTLPGTAAAAYPRIGKALEGIDGVVINGRAEALGSYDVTYKGQSFLVRVQDSNGGGSRLLALSADGRLLTSGVAAELMAQVRAKL